MVAVVIGAVVAAGAERLILRRIPHRTGMSVVSATVGLMLLLNGFTERMWRGVVRGFPSAFPNHPDQFLLLGEARLRYTTIGTWATLLVVLGALWLVLRYTRTGLAFRAVSSSPEMSELMGIRAGQVTTLGWGLAGGIGALAGCLVAPTVLLEPGMMVRVLIFGLVAATIGGLDSLGGAVLGGLVIGAHPDHDRRLRPLPRVTAQPSRCPSRHGADPRVPPDGAVRHPQDRAGVSRRQVPTGAPRTELTEDEPLLVVDWDDTFDADALGTNRSVGRSGFVVVRGSRRWWLLMAIGAVLLILVLVVPVTFLPIVQARLLTRFVALAVALLGLQLTVGPAGQLSLCHGVYVGLGSYTVSILVGTKGWPPAAGLVAAVLVGFGGGCLIGLLAIRIRATYLGPVTLCVAVAFPMIVKRFAWFTGGSSGLRLDHGPRTAVVVCRSGSPTSGSTSSSWPWRSWPSPRPGA